MHGWIGLAVQDGGLKIGKRETQARRGRPTAKDVASLAGVSQSTVSRVLNRVDSQFISEATRQRVLSAAAELGYSPNPIARALRGKKLCLIGLIVREIADPFFASLISELSTQASVLGYQMVLGHAHSDPDEALEMTSILDTRHTDGVIILGDLRDDESTLQEILVGHRAVVTMCRGHSPPGVFTINSNNKAGIRVLLDHLIGLGHRSLAFIDGGWWGDIRERRDEFVAYSRAKGVQVNPEWIQVATNDYEGGYWAMQRLLEWQPRATAVLASDDVLAIGALKAALDKGLGVPGDVSITGFDDIQLARFVSPALTTVRQPITQISEQALQLLTGLIDGEITEPGFLIQVQPELVVRDSTGPAPP